MKFLADFTSKEVEALLQSTKTCVLVPVGSVEPHGPHLPLSTDTIISEFACRDAASQLTASGIATVIAPAIPYGVTDFAQGFAGALSVPADVLTSFLKAIVRGYKEMGFGAVCLVNNHLEPAQDTAVRAACFDESGSVVACPLTRRWARTLSSEFKKGECHAGRYETSLVMAARPDLVHDTHSLKSVPVSLSDGIAAGKKTFLEMGMNEAYAGAPQEASPEEGMDQYALLTAMIVQEVRELLERRSG